MLQRISHRLIAFIVVAIAGLAIIAVNGLVQLDKADEKIELIGGNSLPSIILLAQAQAKFLEVRIDLLNHLMEDDNTKMADVEKELRSDLASAYKALKEYEPYLLDDEDRQGLANERAALDAYVNVLEKVIALSNKNDNDGANELTRTTLRPLGQAALRAFEKHMKYNVDGSDEDRKESDRAIERARIITLVIFVVVAGLLGWVAFSTYQTVVGTTNRARDEVVRVVNELDFSRPLSVEGQNELSDLLRALNQLIERLRTGLSDVRDNADRLATSSAELAGAAHQVQQSSGVQAESASSMAASVEQMTVSINHVSDRTGEASKLTGQSGQLAAGGRESVLHTAERISTISNLVDEAVAELGRLEESGNQISSVVGVIKDVADQTNLLALNAAIEAARAGEQGRGFAVVADEVRKLAERTASSTLEISTMVGAIQQRSSEVAKRMNEAVSSVRDGVHEAELARNAIDDIVTSSGQSGVLVSEIATALGEQSIASNSIAGQVEQVAQMAEENSQAAGRSAELAEELKQLANNMQHVVAAYRLR